jgi:hypothetical protein
MSGTSKVLGIVILGPDGYTAKVDSAGNLQVDVNNAVAIDDAIPIDVNLVSGALAQVGEADAFYANLTGTSDTAVVPAVSGKKILWYYIDISNNGSPTQVQVRFGSGTYKWRYRLPSLGSTLNRQPAVLSTSTNVALNIKLADASRDVDVVVHALYI